MNAYYMKNYPDVFAVDGKKMVKKNDGSFALYDTNELARLSNEGRIVIEYPKSKGGRISGEWRNSVMVALPPQENILTGCFATRLWGN